MKGRKLDYVVRTTRRSDFASIRDLCFAVYPDSPPWAERQLESHLTVFPGGQFVAVEVESQRVLGMAASLIVLWSDYHVDLNWRDFTDRGMFTNHDESGRTLYGAEVMVRPGLQRSGIGSKLYQARRELCIRRRLLRIRAGARLRDYHRYASRMSPEDYVRRIVRGELSDATLSFQLKRGFHVIGVARNYLAHDPDSLGHAAVIEWINHKVARPKDYAGRDAFERSARAGLGPDPPSAKPGPGDR
jgi:GNAT superfamily N-acetyltransferase